MGIKNISIAGSGTVGAQISWHIAVKGFNVAVYDISPIGLEICRSMQQKFAFDYSGKYKIKDSEINLILGRIRYITTIEELVTDCDLLIESIPEKMETKIEFYKKISAIISPKTIISSNTDSFIPSNFTPHYKYPEQLIGTHFTNGLWENPLVEIMGHSETDVLVIEEVIDFVKKLDVLPIVLQKENNGFIMNSLLIPMCSSALTMAEKGIANFEDIDKTWMVIGNKYGPFAIMDVVGLDTVFNIEQYWGKKLNDEQKLSNAVFLQNQYIKKGKLGIKSGEGFYKYPKPKYLRDSFLKN